MRLHSLPPTRGASSTRLYFSSSPSAPELVLSQLSSVRNLVNQSLDIADVSTWTGDQLDARFIFSQLHLLHETITDARHILKGESEDVRGKWEETSANENVSYHPIHIICVGADWLMLSCKDFRSSITAISLLSSFHFRVRFSSFFEDSRT